MDFSDVTDDVCNTTITKRMVDLAIKHLVLDTFCRPKKRRPKNTYLDYLEKYFGINAPNKALPFLKNDMPLKVIRQQRLDLWEVGHATK